MNDYYEILGITRDASQDEIKKAYCKKARQPHPDYTRPESEEASKELSIAYEALSDPEKRCLYDAEDTDALHGGASPLQGAGSFSDLFDAMPSGLSGASPGPIPHKKRRADQLTSVDITLKEAVFGTQKTVSSTTYIECETCHGSMCAESAQPVTYSNRGGSSTVIRISNTMFGQMQSRVAYGACGGYGTIIPSPCQECADQGRVRPRWSHPINIPIGITEDTRVRVPDKAEVGPDGGL